MVLRIMAATQGTNNHNTNTGVLWPSSLLPSPPLADSNCNQPRSLASVPLVCISHSLHWPHHSTLRPVRLTTRSLGVHHLVALTQKMHCTSYRGAKGRRRSWVAWRFASSFPRAVWKADRLITTRHCFPRGVMAPSTPPPRGWGVVTPLFGPYGDVSLHMHSVWLSVFCLEHGMQFHYFY